MRSDQDSAQVRIPPPVLLLSSVLLGTGLQILYPVALVPESLRLGLSVVFVAVGLGTILYCAWMFKKAHTAIEPWKTTSDIVTSGPYRWSRNPIYLSFILIGLGFAFAMNSLWIALLQVPLVAVINTAVIQKEERYLERKFGQAYIDYKRRVRRWI